MLRKLIFYLLVIAIALLITNISFAQSETSEDIVTGGKASCIFRGSVPFKRVVADGNRLLLLQAGGITKASIIIQSIFETKNESIDVNILALLGQILDTDLFLNKGKVQDFENIESDLILKQTKKSDGQVTEVSNVTQGSERTAINGSFKITNSKDNKASGVLNLICKNTFHSVKSREGSVVETKADNGKVIVRCRFKDVPIAVILFEL